MRHTNVLLAAGLQFLAGCATAPFVSSPVEQATFTDRAIEQTQGIVRVAAAVPDADETRSLTGLDLYAKGIQPVWLQVTNLGDTRVRAAIHSVDDEYFSPMEVAWKFRRYFSKQGRADMERWFYENQMPRWIDPGETRSGFVFTHVGKGNKGFNFDVYSSGQSFNFNFFIRMPGFYADYMDVDFERLYEDDEIRVVDLDGLREILAALPCCSADESGNAAGDPINVAVVGTRVAMRRSLLRARWQETAANDPETAVARSHRYRGRPPDGTFQKSRPDGSERKELRLWLSPLQLEQTPVWIGQVSYDMSGATGKKAFKKYHIDPDIDDARMYLLQNFWYSQSLSALGYVGGVPAAKINAPSHNFAGANYFTDGLRVVLFVSEKPIAMDETDILPWELLLREE
ncbi:MAG TPA: LssY C-terminal domain-containing protein [Burkholderiales bacterium]|nr:LssY C-terminal domain-containing protein [Burkholderiales bacterium]